MNSSSQAPKAKKASTPLVASSVSVSASVPASAGSNTTNTTNNTNKRVHEEEDSEKGDLCRSDEEDESDESSENSDDRAFIATDDEDGEEVGKIVGPGGAEDPEQNLLSRLVAMDDDEIIAYWTSEWQKLHTWLEVDEKGRRGVYRLQAATLKMSELALGNKRERILDARERLEAKARATPSVPAQPKPAPKEGGTEKVKDTVKSNEKDESEEAKARARAKAQARAQEKAKAKATETATATATAQPPAAKMDAAPKKIKLSSSLPAPAPASVSVIPPPAAPVREKKQGETTTHPRTKKHDREQT